MHTAGNKLALSAQNSQNFITSCGKRSSCSYSSPLSLH